MPSFKPPDFNGPPMHIKSQTLFSWKTRRGLVLIVGWLVALHCLAFPNPASAKPLSDHELGELRNLFAKLDSDGPIDAVLDRSAWPQDDGMTSYLELEL
ncbi:MAG TPA: hypothetical protein HPQ00_11050, partial [Magnetococcales bacterium]|nr:hypothetical protein [Magnetococcales bacterium]